jgi:hypothetical protein
MKTAIFAVVMVAGLAGCGEPSQSLASHKNDSAPYTGTGKPFAEKDWKQGDKTSWESHLKARSQYGQNDYTRMP